jgi:hypothetical protein
VKNEDLTPIGLFLSLLFFFYSVSYAEEYEWNFDNAQEIKGWTAMNADLKQKRDGVISVLGRSKDPFMLFSPSNLNIPSDLSCIEFKLRVPPTNPYGYILIKTVDNRIGREKYEFSDPNEFNIYIINIKKANLSNAAIDSFTFAFDGGIEAELDYVKFYKPLSIQFLEGYWKQFWEVSYIISATINTIYAPLVGKVSFLKILYILLFLLTICITFLFRPVNIDSIIKSIILSCIIAGILFAIRMDYNWYMQWRLDQASLADKTLDEKLSFVGRRHIYHLSNNLKNLVPPNEKVRVYTGENYFILLFRYYLLPLKVSERGRYILVYRDNNISFDPLSNMLLRNNEVIAKDVYLVSTLGKDIFLYKTDEVSK